MTSRLRLVCGTAPRARRRPFSDPATSAAIAGWRAHPGGVLRPWMTISLGVSVLMLLAVWVGARASSPQYQALPLEGRDFGDLSFILGRNILVLALHGFACVAAYLAGAAIPAAAARYQGWRRRIYLAVGPAAMLLVGLLILRSLVIQVAVLGHGAAALANGLGIGPGELLLMLSLHAVPELTGMFLPLAAWVWLAWRRRPEQMLAGAVASCIIGAVLILAAGVIEVWVTPGVAEAVLR